jgi:hypothetical protein
VFYLNLLACKNNFVSIGGITELAWASVFGVHTIVTMQPDSMHHHAFVLEGADIVLEKHEDAMTYLFNLIKQRG